MSNITIDTITNEFNEIEISMNVLRTHIDCILEKMATKNSIVDVQILTKILKKDEDDIISQLEDILQSNNNKNSKQNGNSKKEVCDNLNSNSNDGFICDCISERLSCIFSIKYLFGNCIRCLCNKSVNQKYNGLDDTVHGESNHS
jgi:hypothetical protein